MSIPTSHTASAIRMGGKKNIANIGPINAPKPNAVSSNAQITAAVRSSNTGNEPKRTALVPGGWG